MDPSKPLPYGRQWIDEDDIEAVVRCLRGDWLTQGPLVETFENALCEVTGAKYAVAVSSGTAALHLAAMAAGVKPGNTGITSAITFVASANCIAYCGGEPHFANVDPTTGLIDLGSLESLIDALIRSDRAPKVIIPVDFAGQCADLQAVQKLARRCGAIVVEDAAHSLGATYHQDGQIFRAAGCIHSDMAILSFHPVKTITTGEGGAILTNNEYYASRLRDMRTHGIHKDPSRLTRPEEGPWYYEQSELGFHYRITDLQCALGISQLKKLPQFLARRQEIAQLYDEALSRPPFAEWIEPLQKAPQTVSHAYHLYVIRLKQRTGESWESVACRRKELYMELRERKIQCQVHYIPVPMQPYYEDRCSSESCDCAGARTYYASALSLPIFPRMDISDVARVVSSLLELSRT